MKKITALFFALLIAITSFQFAPSAFAVSVIDQEFSTPGGLSALIIKPEGLVTQSFRPSQPKLDKVSVNLRNTSGTINFGVSKFNGNDFDPVTYINDQPAVDGWNTFNFEDIDVTVGGRYRIWLEASSDTTKWYYGTQEPDGPYPRGTASWGWPEKTDKTNADFQFITYGYGPAVPNQSVPASTSNSATSAASTIGETFGTVSTSIVKPSNLTAVYSKDDNGVKLTWKASTTADIDGYKIFRSESEKTSFTKIKEVTKEKLDEIDQIVSAEKTYYYQVRAYKGVNQSASSNTATVTAPENIPPAKPVKLKVVDSTDSMIKITWRKTQDTSVTGYTINLYKQGEKIRTSELQANDELYSFLGLDPLTVYKVELIAKNAKGETSSPAITYGYTSVPEEIGVIMDSIKLLAAILVLILLLVLAFRTKKHYQKK